MSKIIVLLNDDADIEQFLLALEWEGLGHRQMSAMPNIIFVDSTTADTFPLKNHPAIATLEDDQPDGFKPAEVVTIEPSPVSGAWPILRHTSRDRPWGDAVNLPWSGDFQCVRDGDGVDVYLVDTGVLATHSEFGGRAEAIDSWMPTHHHGTSCASCAVGNTLGIARKSLVFVAAGLRNTDGSGSSTDIIAAMNACLSHYNSRADTNRPAVLSMSFGGSSTVYGAATAACIDAGMVALSAATNNRAHIRDADVYPGEHPGVILVAGINMDDLPYDDGTYGTNYGNDVDILGGSQNVRLASIINNNGYRTGSGTSYGTPHVAGVVAGMLQGYKRLTGRAQVQEVGMYLYQQATFGRYRPDPRFEPMTPAIAYLDPGAGPYPEIPTLERL